MSDDITRRLRAIGLDDGWLRVAEAEGVDPESLGRVASEHGDRLVVLTPRGELAATAAGRLRRGEASERPSVGDVVAVREGEAGSLSLVTHVLPRRSQIARKAAGRATEAQVVAANIDVVLVVCALGRDVNERRIERFAAVAYDGGARPVVVLNKADLLDPGPYLDRARAAAPGCEVVVLSALSGQGLEGLSPLLSPGTTLALVGTSGAGKSTLTNRLLGREAELTAEVLADGRGRHTSTRRQLHLLPQGASIVDTPGLREVGLWTADEGLARAFEDVAELAEGCRFSDCRHEGEPGCAVARAEEQGELDPARAESFRRLRREQESVERRAASGGRKRRLGEKTASVALRQRLLAKGRR